MAEKSNNKKNKIAETWVSAPPKYDLNEYGTGQWELTKMDLNYFPAWALDSTHSIPPWTPYEVYEWCELVGLRMFIWGSGRLSLPYTKGTVFRAVRGCVYMSPMIIEDEEEIRKRQAVFKDKLRPYLEDFGKVYKAHQDELYGLFNSLKDQNFDKLKPYQLQDALNEMRAYNLVWLNYHGTDLYAGTSVFTMFEDLCMELLGIDDTSPLFLRLFQGLDNALLDGEAELEKLAVRARQMGLRDAFLVDPLMGSKVVDRLEESIDGRTWLKAFREFMDYYGWRRPRLTAFHKNPSWFEDPTPPFLVIKQHILEKSSGTTLSDQKKVTVEDRKKAEVEILARVPEARRKEFRALMRAAQWGHVHSSEHSFTYDERAVTLERHIIMACGRRLVIDGLISDPEDVWFLNPPEVWENLLYGGYRDLRRMVKKRKALYQQYCSEIPRPMFIGSLAPDKAVERMMASRDSCMMKISGAKPVKPRPELNACLYGLGVSKGVVEGTARVIMEAADKHKLHKGEILVTTAASSSWTSAFGIISGAVLDTGGSMCHAAVEGREYRIPVVTATKNATAKIETGDRIRVNADEGTVYNLKKRLDAH